MGSPKNMTIIAQGGEIHLDVFFYAYAGGGLADTDSLPTYDIKDPSGATIATGSGVRESLGKYIASYTLPINAEISDQWRIEWTAFINGNQVADSWEYFRVVLSGSVIFDSNIVIENKWLAKIKVPLAYPKLEKIVLIDDEIKEYCIEPALRRYFIKFPKKVKEDFTIGNDNYLELDFPDEFTFGATDIRVTDKGGAGSTAGSSSFWELVKYQGVQGGSSHSNYGIQGYNPNFLSQVRETERQSDIANINSRQAIKIDVDTDAKQIKVYSNVSGKILVEWAKYSVDFADVKFQQIENVIKLSQSYLLRQLGEMADLISDTNSDVEINSDNLISRADTLEEQVMELWDRYPDIVVVRT